MQGESRQYSGSVFGLFFCRFLPGFYQYFTSSSDSDYDSFLLYSDSVKIAGYDDTRVKRSESRCKLACKRIFDLLTRQKHE